MNNEEKRKSIVEVIQSQLKSGKVQMRSKTYFLFQNISIFFLVFLSLFLITFFLSFIFFILQANGSIFLPVFGFKGWVYLFTSLPWLIIIATLILIALLEFFIKKYAIVYRQPIFYSLFIILLAVLIGGFVLRNNRLHTNFLYNSQDRDVPIFGPMYLHYSAHQAEKIYTGQVVSIVNNKINLLVAKNHEVEIIILPETRLDLDNDLFPGSWIMVMGEQFDNQIMALGIHGLDEEWGPRFKGHLRIMMPSVPRMK